MDTTAETARLVRDYRDRCLWFLRPDYTPATPEAVLRTLELIERYGDRVAWQRVAEIRAWLSRDSKPTC